MLACQVAHADVGKTDWQGNLNSGREQKETTLPVLSSSFFIHLHATQESLDALLINPDW